MTDEHKVVIHSNNSSKEHISNDAVSDDNRLESCCCNTATDKRLYVLIVQTIISIGIIIFSAVMLADKNIGCERSQMFVSLISLIVGYWIKSPISS